MFRSGRKPKRTPFLLSFLFQIKSHDQPNRMEIYETTVEVMETQITKLRKLLHFQVSRTPQGCLADTDER